MGETIQKPLFETRRHASRPYSSNYPPQQQLKEGDRGGLLSYIPFQGLSRLQEKWSVYRQLRRLRRLVSLFVFARGLTTIFGNVNTEDATRNALLMMDWGTFIPILPNLRNPGEVSILALGPL